MNKCYSIYILQSEKDGRYYVGSTNNLEKRIVYHNKGRVLSTKNFVPWNLKYKENFDSLSMARKREQQIKNWKKRSAIEKLINAPIV